MRQPLVYFSMWHCHCSFLAYTKAEIPLQCPEHATDQLAAVGPEQIPFNPPISYGYAPQSACGCVYHQEEIAVL